MPAGPSGFRDRSLGDFVDRLGSSEPVPGGGSASAVVGSLAAALVAMVAVLSEGRPRYADHAAVHAWGKEQGQGLAARLLSLAEEDAAAYLALTAAMKLPRETDAQQVARMKAIRVAARLAAEMPLRCVEACRSVVAAAEALAGRSNVHASSDLKVAALLGEAAARGAAANVIVNLPAAGDEVFAARARGRVEDLLADTARLAAEAERVVDRGDSRAPRAPGPVP